VESERSCCICRGRAPKYALARFVCSEHGLSFDNDQRLSGRGAYVHKNPHCVARAAHPARWERVLRLEAGRLQPAQVAKVFKEVLEKLVLE
jgi:predicted RNA-binding protein YlxR (DUF448 family)